MGTERANRELEREGNRESERKERRRRNRKREREREKERETEREREKERERQRERAAFKRVILHSCTDVVLTLCWVDTACHLSAEGAFARGPWLLFPVWQRRTLLGRGHSQASDILTCVAVGLMSYSYINCEVGGPLAFTAESFILLFI